VAKGTVVKSVAREVAKGTVVKFPISAQFIY